LTTMERENIPRNLATYAACAYSCEKAGEGLMALHVMDLMNNEGYELDTPVYKAAIWACVKVRQCSQFLLHNGLRSIFY
jgi:hypothetical protein